MAYLEVPIKVNLPDNWADIVVDKLAKSWYIIITAREQRTGHKTGKEKKMKRELTPQAMVMREQQAKAKIKKCNEQIRKNTEVYNNWEYVTDERILR